MNFKFEKLNESHLKPSFKDEGVPIGVCKAKACF